VNKPNWPSPTDLRCVGGPADGKWFAVPPTGYTRENVRGGAYWGWTAEGLAKTLLGFFQPEHLFPRSALPGESV